MPPIAPEWIAVMLAGAAMMAMQAYLNARAARESRDLTNPATPYNSGPRNSGAPSATLSAHDRSAIAEALRSGRKIEAIKLMRVATGAGLSEAREAVEAMQG